MEFYANHINGMGLLDPDSLWWPEWHGVSIANDGVPALGRRVLISTRARPNLSKFRLYSDNIDLSGDSALYGPFEFSNTSTRVNTSGKAGAQIPHLPLGDDSPPLGEMMQYVCKLTRFTRLCVTSHSQPLINAKYKFQVTNYL
jgi:hypothetical protein